VQAAWALVLSRNSGEEDVVVGVTRACRKGTIPNSESVVGLFINTLPVRVRISPETAVGDWLQAVDLQRREIRAFEHTPLVDVQKWSDVPAGSPLFNSIVVFTPRLIGAAFRELGGPWLNRTIEFHERTNYPLTLFVYGERELLIKLSYDRTRFTEATAARLLAEVTTAIESLVADAGRKLKDIAVLSRSEQQLLLTDWNLIGRPYPSDRCIHEQLCFAKSHLAIGS
jgi:non-ribosomal peptide synthetase component F